MGIGDPQVDIRVVGVPGHRHAELGVGHAEAEDLLSLAEPARERRLRAGAAERAAQLIGEMLARPTGTTPEELRADPDFDRIVDDPRVRQALEAYPA